MWLNGNLYSETLSLLHPLDEVLNTSSQFNYKSVKWYIVGRFSCELVVCLDFVTFRTDNKLRLRPILSVLSWT